MHRLLILDKRNRENCLTNINLAAKSRALCPGRMSAWHLLPLPKQAGKWERGDQPGQRQWELLSSCTPVPVIPWVTPGWGGQSAQDSTNTTHFKSWMGVCFFPHVLSSIQVDSSGAGGRAAATHWWVSQSPSKRACPQCWGLLRFSCSPLWDGAVSPWTTEWDGILWQHPLRSLGLQLNQQKNIHLARKILSFLKQLVLQVHQAGASMVSLIETSRTFEEEGWKQGSWENKCSFF